MAQEWTIRDERTKYCYHAMRACRGAWVGGTVGWIFRDAGDYANALAEFYRATRATLDQRDQLAEMIIDGTAALAWEIELDALAPDWARHLEGREAARLIAAGRSARRVLGRHPLEDLPADIDDGCFDTSVFERACEARRERLRRVA